MQSYNRRNFLAHSSAILLSGLAPKTLYAEVIHKIRGRVWVNDSPMKPKEVIRSGDIIRTEKESETLFVVGGDAHWIKENSTLQVRAHHGSFAWLHLLSGLLMSSFDKGDKKIMTPLATIGIRGTVTCLKVDTQEIYFCTCHGETLISSNQNEPLKTVNATHHFAHIIRYDHNAVSVAPASQLLYHDDKGVVAIEHAAGRKAPLVFQ